MTIGCPSLLQCSRSTRPTMLRREFLPFRNSFGLTDLSQFRLSLPCAYRDGYPDPSQVALRTAYGHTGCVY